MKLFDALVNFARRQSLKGKEKDSSSTSLLPLAEISRAVVIFDGDLPGSVQIISRVQDFFTSRGKKVDVFAVTVGIQLLSEGMQKATFIHKGDINWYGRVKSGRRFPNTDVGEDLFISIFDKDTFLSEYAARCSKAAFKIGRNQLPGDIYDLVITDPQGRHLTQLQAFDAISEFISKIQY